jgi:hypothetical protein
MDLLKNTNGGRLEVGPGEFLIDRSLDVGDNVLISGQGRFSKLVFAGDYEIALSVKDALDVEICEILIVCRDQSVSSGIVVSNSGSCLVRDSKIVGFKKYGVVLANNTFLSRIESCEVAGNKVSNIYFMKLDSLGRMGNYIPNTVSNCMLVGGGKGIEFMTSTVANIQNNSFTQCQDHAIHLHSQSNAVLITGNHTFQIDGHSLLVEGFSHELNVTGNTFSWSTGSSVVVKQSCWGTIAGNVFIDNGFSPDVQNLTTVYKKYEGQYEPQDAVILEDVTGYTVSSNTIYNWQVSPQLRNGIVEDSLSYRNIISNNTINWYKNKAVDSKGKGTIVKDNNSRADVPYHWMPSKADKDNVRFELKPETHRIQSWIRQQVIDYVEKY